MVLLLVCYRKSLKTPQATSWRRRYMRIFADKACCERSIASETVSRDRRSVCGWLECEPLTWSLVLAPVAAKQDAKNYGEFAACWRDGSQCLVAIGFLSHLVKKKLILKTITFRTGVYGVPWQIVPVNLFFLTYVITFHQHYRQTW